MSNERLCIDDSDKYAYRIGWYFPDECEFGMHVGEHRWRKEPNAEKNPGDWQDWAVYKALKRAFPKAYCGNSGFEFDTRSEAAAALRVAKAALRQNKPMPDWAVKATTAGWKPPRGWKA